jgi:acetyltransferase
MQPDASPVELVLRDGRCVVLRMMTSDDETELLQAFERMSEDARYMRFMRVVREPNLERLRSTLASFPQQGVGLVATAPADDGIDIVGSAIAVIAEGGAACEFAINVDARFGGSGLATALMKQLVERARRRGVRLMEGFVLADNASMLRLARRLGFTIGTDPDDPGVRICRLELAG